MRVLYSTAGGEGVTDGENKGGLSIHGTNFRGVISAKNILNVKTHKQQKLSAKDAPFSIAKKKSRIFLLACKGGKNSHFFHKNFDRLHARFAFCFTTACT